MFDETLGKQKPSSNMIQLHNLSSIIQPQPLSSLLSSIIQPQPLSSLYFLSAMLFTLFQRNFAFYLKGLAFTSFFLHLLTCTIHVFLFSLSAYFRILASYFLFANRFSFFSVMFFYSVFFTRIHTSIHRALSGKQNYRHRFHYLYNGLDKY